MDVAGMQLSDVEVAAAGMTQAPAAQVPALVQRRGRWWCERCGQTNLVRLPDGRWYCPHCVVLGRLTSTSQLYRFANAAATAGPLSWHGQLTPAQAQAAREVTAAALARRDHLVWAVTGAGKTELLFPAVAAVLARGERVAWASPRVDVVLELAPRLQAAFATTPVAVRYGGAPWPSVAAPLVVTTTHQLLRYYHAFGLIIVDEIDAFPYTAEPGLAYAVQQAKLGAMIALTATPSVALRRAVSRQTIGVSRLTRRFHGHPLPVPQLQLVRAAQLPNRLAPRLLRQIAQALTGAGRLLLFVPAVAWLPVVARQLQHLGHVATVHATDPARQAKVQALRRGAVDILVTTTILERGVTIPHCAVMVLGANSPLFSAAALIQMAGRAGRASTSPDDPVWFVTPHVTRNVLAARREIRALNRAVAP